MKWIESDNPVTFYDTGEEQLKTYPTNKIRVPVNKENVLNTGIVAAKDADKIVDYIDITVDERGLTKNRILMLDILANFDWKKPLYFTGGASDAGEYIWLKDYLQLDGMSYKLVPILTSNEEKTMFDMGRIDTEKMYNNLQKLEWRNINSGTIYIDEQTRKNAISLRNNMLRLAETFANEANFEKAEEILDLSINKMPIRDFGHISIALGYPEIYYKIGNVEKARKTVETLIDMIQQRLRWYSTFDDEYLNVIIPEVQNELYVYKQGILDQVGHHEKDKEYVKKLQEEFTNTLSLFSHLMEE
jgi:tetratricopeptide (TPR) repeat protein